MHRATPSGSSFRAFVSGGSRATLDKMDDSKLMQEATANFHKGETRSAIESPQNYGFTSANFGKDDSGAAEASVHFMGGNRSFPVMGPVDDRRHRLTGLSEGDTAMHRGKDDAMQIHLASDGMYHSAPQMVRLQLVPAGSSKQAPPSSSSGGKGSSDAGLGDPGGGDGGQGGSGGAVEGFAASSGSSGGSSGGGQQQQGKNKPSGQKAVSGAGKDSKDFVHVKSGEARMSSASKVRLSTSKEDDDVLHESGSGKDYVGGTPAKHKFSKILTLAGPSVNGLAKIG